MLDVSERVYPLCYVHDAVASRSARSRPRSNGASKISSRTRAGLERVRAQSKTLGRTDVFTTHGPTLALMKAEGYSRGQMSRETGLAINSVKSYLKRLEALPVRREEPRTQLERNAGQNIGC